MTDPATLKSQDVVYEVKPGDSLSLIAKSLTGLLESWEVIATYNGITNPKSLTVGQTIRIPRELITPVEAPSSHANVASSAASSIRETAASGNNTPTRMSVTTGNSFSVVSGQSSVKAGELAPITIHPVVVNRSFTLEPIDPTLALQDRQRSYGSEAPQIKVSGTYYPKGIYEEPANYARLIRRAAPGTRFTLEKEINNWYKIITEDGVGYIRQSDSTLVD